MIEYASKPSEIIKRYSNLCCCALLSCVSGNETCMVRNGRLRILEDLGDRMSCFVLSRYCSHLLLVWLSGTYLVLRKSGMVSLVTCRQFHARSRPVILGSCACARDCFSYTLFSLAYLIMQCPRTWCTTSSGKYLPCPCSSVIAVSQ